jgi:murein DD-endopeptidase MepM/ murein hydrolase activator NlpD
VARLGVGMTPRVAGLDVGERRLGHQCAQPHVLRLLLEEAELLLGDRELRPDPLQPFADVDETPLQEGLRHKAVIVERGVLKQVQHIADIDNTVIRRIAALLIALGVLALSPAAAHAAGEPAHDPLTLAQQRLDATRTEATEISGRIAAAQTQQAKLQDEITAAEARIPQLRARAAELKAIVKQRAAQLYVQHGATAGLESAMDAENAEDGLRAAHLTDALGAQDLDAATKLRDTAAELSAREAALKNQKADLEKALASLAPLNDLLQKKLEIATAAYDKVQALVVAGPTKHGADLATGATVCPVKGVAVFTDDFGELRPGGPHPGIDMGALTGTPVVAVAPGFMRHDISEGGGNGAWLAGLDNFSYYYAHFSRYEGGDRIVNAGDVIGYVGSTGNSTGPHLHFEMHPGKPGEKPPVDPFATLLGLCNENLPPTPAN